MSEDQLLHTLEGMRRMTERCELCEDLDDAVCICGRDERAKLEVALAIDETQLVQLVAIGQQMKAVTQAFHQMVKALAPGIRKVLLAMQEIERDYDDFVLNLEDFDVSDPNPPSPSPTPAVSSVPLHVARRRIEGELAKRGPAVDLTDEEQHEAYIADTEVYLAEDAEAEDESDNCPHDESCKGGSACCRAQGEYATQARIVERGVTFPIGGAGVGCTGPCCVEVRG